MLCLGHCCAVISCFNKTLRYWKKCVWVITWRVLREIYFVNVYVIRYWRDRATLTLGLMGHILATWLSRIIYRLFSTEKRKPVLFIIDWNIFNTEQFWYLFEDKWSKIIFHRRYCWHWLANGQSFNEWMALNCKLGSSGQKRNTKPAASGGTEISQ